MNRPGFSQKKSTGNWKIKIGQVFEVQKALTKTVLRNYTAFFYLKTCKAYCWDLSARQELLVCVTHSSYDDGSRWMKRLAIPSMILFCDSTKNTVTVKTVSSLPCKLTKFRMQLKHIDASFFTHASRLEKLKASRRFDLYTKSMIITTLKGKDYRYKILVKGGSMEYTQ